MNRKNYNLTATKKPREDPISDKPINFPPLENLHLELLENKKKIKPGVPDAPIAKKRVVPIIIPSVKSNIKEDFKKITEDKKNIPSHNDKISKKEDSKKNISKESSTPTPKEKEPKPPKPKKSDPEELILEEIIEDDDDEIEEELEDEIGDTEDIQELTEDNDHTDEEEEQTENENQDDVTDTENQENEEDKKEEKEEEEDNNDPYYGLSPEEREKKEKEEYIWRFRILKKKYRNPSIEIPDYNEHSELSDMKTAYERTTKELYLDGAVDQYRTYLIGGFMVSEFVCTNWFNIDLGGFTMQQTKMMYKYDMLLIELGEKSYNKWGMNIPVEIRIAGLILLQAGLFYLGKVISANYGNSVAGLFKGITGQPSESPDTGKEEPVKKKMKGPRFKAEDIRNMAHVKSE